MRRSLYLLLAASAFLALAASASAAPTWLPSQQLAAGGPVLQPEGFLLEWPSSVAIDGEGNVALVGSRDLGPTFSTLSVSRPAGGPWDPPAEISLPGEETLAPQTAFDAAGDETAIWLDDDSPASRIMAATRPAAGSWEGPVPVSAPGVSFELDSLAVAPAGEATAVWSSEVGREEDVVMASSKPPGGAWEEPVALSAIAAGAGNAQVAVDAAGEFIAVWEPGRTTEGAIQIATKPPAGAWAKATNVSPAGSPASDPQLAVDAGGDTTVIWASELGGQAVSLQSAARSAGGSWQLHTVAPLLEAGAGYARLAIDSAGEATAVWQTSDTSGSELEAASSRLGGAWGPAVQLSDEETSIEPQVAYRGGEAVAIWRGEEDDMSEIETATKPAGETWSGPTVLAGGGDRAVETPALAFDAEGEGVAAWYGASGEGADPDYEIEAAGYDAVGPRLGSASIPATGTAGVPLAFSVSPLDVWSGVGATEWSFGDGGAAGGTSASHTYANPGTYEVTLSSTDLVGNTSTLTRTVTIEPPAPSPSQSSQAAGTKANAQAASPAEPPRVNLRYTPNRPHRPNPSGGPRYTFHFSDPSGQATFMCRLDRAPFRRCDSPKVYRHLRRGRHVFRVKAISPTAGSSPVRTVRFIAGRRG